MNMEKLETALGAAFSHAIRKIGIPAFKRTSMFGSNDAAARDEKKAA